jgi:hypothetical protein
VSGPAMDAAIAEMLNQPDAVKNRIVDLLRGN